MGEDSEIKNLIDFSELLNRYTNEFGLKEFSPKNSKFIDLQNNERTKFLPATQIGHEEIEYSNIFKNQTLREIAINLRKSGGLLEHDLVVKKEESLEEILKNLRPLVESPLITVDYVVVCNQSNKQINRAKNLESLQQLDSIGVTCSCGKKISDERIEKLFSPQPILQKLLDKSFWMSAHLIYLLQKLGIPKENILINLAEGPEEIDAIVDIEGFLVMFELKDNEFSMGHAYPFQARISIYAPDYSVIVATKGISKDVKDHFVRAKPETKMSYIDNLDELEEKLNEILYNIRSQRALNVLRIFDAIASIEIPLSSAISKQINLIEQER